MTQRLPNEAAVLAAVDRLLEAGFSGLEVPEAMAVLVAETSSIPLNNLEAWERAIRTQLWAFQHAPVTAARWSRKNRTVFASWLDLCSGDGFKRERAVRTLSGGAPNAFVLAMAARRLNDWVPQVRAAAREQLPRYADDSSVEHVLDALWIVLAHSSSWGRMEAVDRQVIDDLVSSDRVAPALGSRIIAAIGGPVTQILSQAGRTPALDERLEEIANSAIQPSVRATAYRRLLEGRMVWVVGRKWRWTDLKWCKGRFEPVTEERALSVSGDFLARLKAASGDRSALVRRVAAEFLIKELTAIGHDAVPLAERLASDRSTYVAERGRFALASLGVAREVRDSTAT
jgi:hypothetical protein